MVWLCHTAAPAFTGKSSDWAQHQRLPWECWRRTDPSSLLATLCEQKDSYDRDIMAMGIIYQIFQDIPSFANAVLLSTTDNAIIWFGKLWSLHM